MEFLKAVEINPLSRQVYHHHFPGVELLEDVRSVSFKPGDCDVLIGGFPCTGTSQAGSKTGLRHSASSLWFEFLRLVRECRPLFVGIENPAGIINRGLRACLGGLRMEGYQSEVQLISAAGEGAPHQRDRVFIIAYPDHLSELFNRLPGWEEQITLASKADPAGQRQQGSEWSELSEPKSATGIERLYSERGTAQPGNTLLDDGVPGWLGDAALAGWWSKNKPPKKAGIEADEIPPSIRRFAISAYGLAVCPEQAKHVWNRIWFLWNALHAAGNVRSYGN